MQERTKELQGLAELAAQTVASLPEALQPALGAEVFRALWEGDVRRTEPRDTVVSPRNIATIDKSQSRSVPDVETLGEYLAAFRNPSHPVRIVAIAAFRFERDGVDSITADDILRTYADLRAPRPQNLSANLARCITRGWLVTAGPRDGAKSWRVTKRGLAMLKEELGEG